MIVPKKYQVDYKTLSSLAPKEYPVVSVYNKQLGKYKDKKVFRKYISYGVSPKFKNTGKSYMFNNQTDEIPEELKGLLEFAKEIDPRYNNVYVNWYKDGNDYIEPHSDCIDSLVPGSFILIVNINEGNYERTFKIQNKKHPEFKGEIKLEQYKVITLHGGHQRHYRHWVEKADTTEGRISVTFRAVKEIL